MLIEMCESADEESLHSRELILVQLEILRRRLLLTTKSKVWSLWSLLLADSSGNAIHIGDTLLGQGLSESNAVAIFSLEVDVSDQATSEEGLEAVADVLSSSHARCLSLGASAVLGSIVPSETLGSSSLMPHVELIGNASGTVVQPVIVLRWQFLLASSLNVGAPLFNIINLI